MNITFEIPRGIIKESKSALDEEQGDPVREMIID
jgi:hypothetical protein